MDVAARRPGLSSAPRRHRSCAQCLPERFRGRARFGSFPMLRARKGPPVWRACSLRSVWIVRVGTAADHRRSTRSSPRVVSRPFLKQSSSFPFHSHLVRPVTTGQAGFSLHVRIVDTFHRRCDYQSYTPSGQTGLTRAVPDSRHRRQASTEISRCSGAGRNPRNQQ